LKCNPSTSFKGETTWLRELSMNIGRVIGDIPAVNIGPKKHYGKPIDGWNAIESSPVVLQRLGSKP
jgi:hypothetical protein